MRTRYYRPDLRRFINADILTGSIDDSDTLNQYAYVEGNLFSMIDPFGMCAEPGSGTKSKSIVQKLKGLGKSIKKGYKKFADVGHLVLDIAGIIPGLGMIPDGINAVWYLAELDGVNAGLSAAAFVPIIGDAAGVGKVAVKGAKAVDKAADAAKVVDKVSDAAKAADKVGDAAKAARKVDFYVTPKGDVVPSTGYRYMDSRYASQTMASKHAPGSYFGFEKFDTASSAKDAYQIAPEWSDVKLRGEFDTLQVIDGMYVPKKFGDVGPGLEPFASCYPEYGKGGCQQFIYKGEIYFRDVVLLAD